MKYTSTRNASQVYTFEEALFSGYAPDGGLFVPVQLPDFFSSVSKTVLLKEWANLGYQDLATEILHPFIGPDEISKQDLGELLERALSGFDVSDENKVPVIPLTREDDRSVDCYVAELFHGPTYCFKVCSRINSLSKKYNYSNLIVSLIPLSYLEILLVGFGNEGDYFSHGPFCQQIQQTTKDCFDRSDDG